MSLESYRGGWEGQAKARPERKTGVGAGVVLHNTCLRIQKGLDEGDISSRSPPTPHNVLHGWSFGDVGLLLRSQVLMGSPIEHVLEFCHVPVATSKPQPTDVQNSFKMSYLDEERPFESMKAWVSRHLGSKFDSTRNVSWSSACY